MWIFIGIALGALIPVTSRGQVMLFDKKAELTGTFSAQASVYSTDNAYERMEPFSWRIYGNPRLKVKDFDIPMNFILGSYEDRLRQAYNKFGMSPKYKEIITLHLGHRNVNFSPLVLGGKTILGAGFELNAKNFRAGFMYGRFDRAVNFDSAAYIPPTYRRSGYAAKIGYGTRSNYIDLVFLKAGDDESSLAQTGYTGFLAPAENAVIGLTVRQSFAKNFHFRFDAALSAYSMDKGADEVEDPDLLLGKMMKVFIPLRVSNQYLTGLKAGLEYRVQKFTVGLDYDRLEPDFQSMGSYYIRNDMERITAFGRFNALKQKLMVSARTGFQRNNILKDRSFSNFQNINNLDASYMLNNAWNFSLSYGNFLTRQTLELLGQDDSTLLDQRIHNVSAGATYRWSAEMRRNTFSGRLSFQDNFDRAPNGGMLMFRSFNTQFRYRIDMTGRKLYISPAFVFNLSRFSALSTNRFSPSVIVGKAFFDQKLSASLNSGLSFTITDGARQKTVFRNILNVTYKIYRKQTLSMRLSLSNNRGNALGAATFTEFQGEVIYSVSL